MGLASSGLLPEAKRLGNLFVTIASYDSDGIDGTLSHLDSIEKFTHLQSKVAGKLDEGACNRVLTSVLADAASHDNIHAIESGIQDLGLNEDAYMFFIKGDLLEVYFNKTTEQDVISSLEVMRDSGLLKYVDAEPILSSHLSQKCWDEMIEIATQDLKRQYATHLQRHGEPIVPVLDKLRSILEPVMDSKVVVQSANIPALNHMNAWLSDKLSSDGIQHANHTEVYVCVDGCELSIDLPAAHAQNIKETLSSIDGISVSIEQISPYLPEISTPEQARTYLLENITIDNTSDNSMEF
ncbi:hypothetical protein [Neptuniibacter sp. QD37_11]|uniref:hypothetical protein n=1 Tax=Neptuniibacter sp. QD37_11 TaxID=3398209 RepID=UPI0039F59CFF